MARVEDWQNNLAALIERRRNSPRQFGQLDCCMWSFEGIEAITGEDRSGEFRGRYSTARGALSVMRRVAKVEQPYDYFVAMLGEKRGVGMARKGDLVFADPSSSEITVGDGMETFGLVPGICYGFHSYFVGETGLVQMETLKLDCALWVS